jgi:hypothetical protein
MKEMGSKTGEFAPEPRDQYVWQKNKGETALDRLIGYVKLHSVGRHPPCAFVVHDNGNPYSSQQIAIALGWTHGHAKNTIAAGKRAGLLRQRGGGAIGLSGHVPGANKTTIESALGSAPVQVPYAFSSPIVLAQIHRLSPELQKEALAWGKAFDAWAAGVYARQVTETRRIIHEAQYSALPQLGVKLPPAKPKKAAPKLSFAEELAQVLAPPVPAAFKANRAAPGGTCTGADSAPVQVTVSLLTSETTREGGSGGSSSLVDNAAEGVQPVPTPGLVETPDALDSISKERNQDGPNRSTRLF